MRVSNTLGPDQGRDFASALSGFNVPPTQGHNLKIYQTDSEKPEIDHELTIVNLPGPA